MFVVAAMLYGLGTIAIVLIPPKGSSDNDQDDKVAGDETSRLTTEAWAVSVIA